MKEFLIKNKGKIVVSTLVLVGLYFFVYKNRVPKLKINPNVNWNDKISQLQFGNNKTSLQFTSGVLDAGSSFSDKYKLVYRISGNTTILEVKDKNDNIIDKQTIDYKNKIIY